MIGVMFFNNEDIEGNLKYQRGFFFKLFAFVL